MRSARVCGWGAFGIGKTRVPSCEVFLPNQAFFLVNQTITPAACVIITSDKAFEGWYPVLWVCLKGHLSHTEGLEDAKWASEK